MGVILAGVAGLVAIVALVVVGVRRFRRRRASNQGFTELSTVEPPTNSGTVVGQVVAMA